MTSTHRKRSWRGALLAASLLFAGPLAAQNEVPPAPGPPRDFRVPARRTVTLPNGMQVAFIPYGTIPKVMISLQVTTGAIDEGPREIQLAGLTAGMLLEGTATRSASDISREAAEMGGSIDAGAGDDNVGIGGEVLSEFAEAYVQLLADVVLRPRFAAADLDRLRNDRMRANAIAQTQPGQIARVEFRRLLFGEHPYGRVFAPESLLRTYDTRKVRAFHERNFGARRARLYVSGVYDEVALERAVRQAFGGWKKGAPPTRKPATPVAQRQLRLIDRPDAVQSTIRLGVPVVAPASPDWVRLSVTDALLGGSFGSRITSNIREDKGYTYSPFSFMGTWTGTAVWIQVADVTSDVTGASLREIFYEVSRLRADPPAEAELEGIRNNLAGVFTIQNSSRVGLVGQLQFVDQHGLGDAFLTDYVRNIHSVTPEDVRRTARRYLDPSRMSILVVGDKKSVQEQVAPYRAAVP